ncbi:type VI secretion system protein TssA [Vibrio vulnificus]|uniref:type VI secretion system protein TssA n=1 Tax=Vibrio vulnificus TaxID=672 RepID=UPI00165D9335|nr:type VI secretion system protein TssA [Vibrio vulnificus]EGR9006341.1 type VI secretion system protein TssA [Vibrio vulnificus]EHU9456227.1 type VI secretion system protein TssA [Vibrio vulnificus]HAS8255735.1 type VI secretion system protein TssA [Vibrio vulnificus]
MSHHYEEFTWFEPALLPISCEQPGGVDPRSDITPQSLYYRLKDQRMQARNIERNAIIEEEPILNYANLWQVFLDEVPQALASQTKDLEYVAWLIEALTRLDGFKGMAVGYELATYYLENYWADLYPMPDEDGLETRISPIIGLNGIDNEGTLIFPLSCIPMTEGLSEQPYAYWEYQQALDLERCDEDKKRAKRDQGVPELSDITQAVKSSSSQFYQRLIEDLNRAISSFERFSQALDSACEEVTPSSYISRKLDAIHSAIMHLASDKMIKVSKETNSDEPSHSASSHEGEIDGRGQGEANFQLLAANMHSREQAIVQLQRVADFFRETEPHSPVSYTIEQVIRWCGMSLPELLAELISDGDAKKGYFRLVGIADKNE